MEEIFCFLMISAKFFFQVALRHSLAAQSYGPACGGGSMLGALWSHQSKTYFFIKSRYFCASLLDLTAARPQ